VGTLAFFFMTECIPLELPVEDSYWYSYYNMSHLCVTNRADLPCFRHFPIVHHLSYLPVLFSVLSFNVN